MLLAVPGDATAYSEDEAAIGGKLITKLGVEAGIGNPLVLLSPEPAPTYNAAGSKLLSVTLQEPSGTFANRALLRPPLLPDAR